MVLPLAVAAMLSSLLLGLGILQLPAAFLATNAGETVFRVKQGQPGETGQLVSAAASLEAAGRWAREGERDAMGGILYYLASEKADNGADRLAYAEASERNILSGLQSAPGQPAPWAVLARLRQGRGDGAGAAQAWRLSILSAQMEPGLLIMRIGEGLKLRPYLDAEMLSMLKQQIRLLWVADSDAVLRLSKRPDAQDLVSEALAQLSPAEMEQFSRAHGRP